jgi:hypothetical protein
MRTSKGLIVFLVTSATMTWDIVLTLLRLLDISNLSSFQQCPTECMLSFDNGHDSGTVPSASELLGNTFNTRDNDIALIYCI